MRGDCVDIPLVRGDCESGVCIPLRVEVIVIVWLSALSLKCEVIVVVIWLSAYPSFVRLILFSFVPCLL